MKQTIQYKLHLSLHDFNTDLKLNDPSLCYCSSFKFGQNIAWKTMLTETAVKKPEMTDKGYSASYILLCTLWLQFICFIQGGSIANIEAAWSARNMKFYPLSLQDAVMAVPELAGAQTYQVSVPSNPAPDPTGNKPFVKLDLKKCSVWQLLNVDVDEACRFVSRDTLSC
jgi:hypothetical protein